MIIYIDPASVGSIGSYFDYEVPGLLPIDIGDTVFDHINNLYSYVDGTFVVSPRVSLVVSTDAIDSNADGLPEIAANGSSSCNITITAYSNGAVATTYIAQNGKISTSNGRLSSRVLTFVGGIASVTLTSSLDTVDVGISATADNAGSGFAMIQFV